MTYFTWSNLINPNKRNYNYVVIISHLLILFHYTMIRHTLNGTIKSSLPNSNIFLITNDILWSSRPYVRTPTYMFCMSTTCGGSEAYIYASVYRNMLLSPYILEICKTYIRMFVRKIHLIWVIIFYLLS